MGIINDTTVAIALIAFCILSAIILPFVIFGIGKFLNNDRKK